jgi:hypothetical protein
VAWKVSFDPDKFEEALEWFRARTPMRAGVYYALEARSRDDAFTVSHVAQMDVVQQVLTAIDKAIETGQDLRQFSAEVRDSLLAAWQGQVGNPAWRLEVIFRTNTGSAFSRGRQLQMDTPVIAEIRPWRLFDDTRDARESDICKACGGTVVRYDDPWLASHTPLLHHCCRSYIRALREQQAKKESKFGKAPPKSQAAEGFGIKPTLANTATTRLKPDYAGYDPELATKGKAKEKAKRPKPPARPKVDPKTTPEHWVPEFSKKYSREVAEAMAHGRACQERALGLPVSVLDTDPVTDRDTWFLRDARKAAPKAKTIKGILDGLEKSKQQYSGDGPIAQAKRAEVDAKKNRVLAIAAETEHRRTVGGQILDKPGLSGHEHLPDKQRWGIERDVKEAHEWLGKSLSPSVVSRQHTIAFEESERAYFSPSRGVVFSGGASTVAHEWAHKLEHENPLLYRRAKAFLETRTRGGRGQRLNEMAPAAGYGDDEVAIPDKFVNPYMGKLYSDATEITSIGVQSLFANHGDELLASDPEYFYFILGQMAGG